MQQDNFFAPSENIAPAPGVQTAAQKEAQQINGLEQETASDVKVHQTTMQTQLQAQGSEYQAQGSQG